MKITVLGSGTLIPNGSRNSSGYFVESAGVKSPAIKMMLDCGAGTLHALARYNVPWQEMTHLFISHFHVDHAGELASLFKAFKYGLNPIRTAPLVMIGPQGLDRVIEGLKHAFGNNLFNPGFPVRFQVIAPGEKARLSDDIVLSVAKTPHNAESLAARIESVKGSLCYTGDTEYSADLAEFFQDAGLLISECSFQDRREGVRHLTIGDAGRIAAEAGVRRLLVTHFYFDVNEASLKAELEKYYSGEVIIGRDGMSLNI